MGKEKLRSHNQVVDLILQALTALGLGSFIFISIIFLTLTIFQLTYNGKIFPGVSVGILDIGGLTIDEAEVRLTQSYLLSNSDSLTLKYLDESISVEVEQLGIRLDAASTAEEAFLFGRSFPFEKWLWQQALIFAPHIDLAPVLIFDEQTAIELLQQIGGERDQPLVEAKLEVEGTRVTATTGQIGRTLIVNTSLDAVREYFTRSNSGNIYLQVDEQYPSMMDANEFIPLAQEILNQPFTIESPEGDGYPRKTWTITPENLAPMLMFEISGEKDSSIVPQINEEYLLGLLKSTSEQVASSPENPRFIFNDDTRKLDLLTEGKNGRTLDMKTSMGIVQEALARGEHKAILSIDYHSPKISNSSSAQELGITELVHMESSYFYGSDQARIHNIETAANQFHGLLIPPREVFSMATAMGEISLDNGYSEALIIFNGKTIEGIGGGVCQVSTTLFRTAFFAGFPIVERHPHAYRVSYYEKVSGNKRDPNLAGLDATVYIPLVDLKFKNDTPYWLLMETYVNQTANRLTWKFYSTYDGRTMNWTTTGPTNTVEPKKPLYQLNTDLDTGEIKQIDWEAEGADVTISRVVSRDGGILFDDSFFTRYEPWRAIYDYGAGTIGIPTQNED
ncbi:MAG: VanW family protein [Deltaproteobacteria bacterium]|nr:VanW family protein [Deltaproteobacteria bacterium]